MHRWIIFGFWERAGIINPLVFSNSDYVVGCECHRSDDVWALSVLIYSPFDVYLVISSTICSTNIVAVYTVLQTGYIFIDKKADRVWLKGGR